MHYKDKDFMFRSTDNMIINGVNFDHINISQSDAMIDKMQILKFYLNLNNKSVKCFVNGHIIYD